MPFSDGIVGSHGDTFWVFECRCLLAHILWNVYQYRAGPARGCDIEGFFNGGCQFPDILDKKVVFDAGTGDADSIDFLECIQADGVGGDLAADDYQWNR